MGFANGSTHPASLVERVLGMFPEERKVAALLHPPLEGAGRRVAAGRGDSLSTHSLLVG